MTTVCLSMIVKNEAPVLARCLASVRPFITQWVVVDTGSTDGTQDVAREALAGVPGEVFERPWKDFAHNRNEAIELARGRADYLLTLDADDVLVARADFALPSLVSDAYSLLVEDGGTTYWRIHFFRPSAGYRYEGVLHEVLVSDGPRTQDRIAGLTYRRTHDGARSQDPDKYRKDAAVLEAALAREPDHARHAFYLAQSWRDAGELEKALEVYRRRAGMGGWEEEAWYAQLEVGKLSARLRRDDDSVIGSYLRAFERRPTRAEPLVYAAAYLRERGRVVAGYPFASAAHATRRPDDVLFVDEAVYAWRAADELAVSAYWVGRYAEARRLNEELLRGDKLPSSERSRVEANLAFCVQRGA